MADNDQRALIVFLLLPKKVQKRVIGSMEPIFSIAFSLCSEKTKLAVSLSKSLRPTHYFAGFGEWNYIQFKLNRSVISIDHEFGDTVEASIDEDSYRWHKTGFNGSSWLRHFKSIFAISRLSAVLISGEPNIDQMNHMLSGMQLRLLVVSRNTPIAHIEPLLRQHPILDGLMLGEPGRISETLCRTMGQNISNFHIDNNRVNMSLDHLLMCNSSHISIFTKPWSTKDVNRFIKLWRRGSNRRMRSLELDVLFAGETFEDCILSGIDYQVNEQVRVFKYDKVCMSRADDNVENGFVFLRADRDQAVCTQHIRGDYFRFEMFVFPYER